MHSQRVNEKSHQISPNNKQQKYFVGKIHALSACRSVPAHTRTAMSGRAVSVNTHVENYLKNMYNFDCAGL